MSAPVKDFTFFGVVLSLLSLFTGAMFGYLGAVVNYGGRIATYDARVQILERQAPKIDAIYDALVRRGMIELHVSQRPAPSMRTYAGVDEQ